MLCVWSQKYKAPFVVGTRVFGILQNTCRLLVVLQVLACQYASMMVHTSVWLHTFASPPLQH